MLKEIYNILLIKNQALLLNSQVKVSIGIKVYEESSYIHLYSLLSANNLGFPGNNSRSEFQASGAYIFRPLTQVPQPVSQTNNM